MISSFKFNSFVRINAIFIALAFVNRSISVLASDYENSQVSTINSLDDQSLSTDDYEIVQTSQNDLNIANIDEANDVAEINGNTYPGHRTQFYNLFKKEMELDHAVSDQELYDFYNKFGDIEHHPDDEYYQRCAKSFAVIWDELDEQFKAIQTISNEIERNAAKEKHTLATLNFGQYGEYFHLRWFIDRIHNGELVHTQQSEMTAELLTQIRSEIHQELKDQKHGIVRIISHLKEHSGLDADILPNRWYIWLNHIATIDHLYAKIVDIFVEETTGHSLERSRSPIRRTSSQRSRSSSARRSHSPNRSQSPVSERTGRSRSRSNIPNAHYMSGRKASPSDFHRKTGE